MVISMFLYAYVGLGNWFTPLKVLMVNIAMSMFLHLTNFGLGKSSMIF